MKKPSIQQKQARNGYLFIAPYFIVFVIFSLYPILYTFKLSFYDWDGLTEPIFLGLANYTRLLADTTFRKSIVSTIVIALGAMIPQMVVALVVAFLLNQPHMRRAGEVFKTVFYFPNLVTAISISVLFWAMFDYQTGSVNQILMDFGILSEAYNWRMDQTFSRFIISFILWWQYFGYYTIIFTAGIRGISHDLIEAAQIDGANRFQQFTRIVLPQLRSIMTFAFTTSIIGGLQIFDLPYAFGTIEGNPNKSILTMVMYMYGTSFENYNYGYGATIAYGLFVIVMIFSIVFFKLTNEKEG